VTPSPVKATALELGLPTSERVDSVLDADVDLGVVVAYGRLIIPPVLGAVGLANLHFSLLPRWRGAAPVERAILAGDTVTGVSLMELEAELDAGPLYATVELEIGADETAAELTGRLADLGASLLVAQLDVGLGEPVPQVGEPTYAAKIEPAEHHLDWSRPAETLHRVIRLGRAWTTWRGRRLLVLAATEVGPTSLDPGVLEGVVVGTGDGGLALAVVQPEGRAAIPAADWCRGARPQPGERMGT
jgi:methionyl-tRNA formyltransferase